MKHIYPFALRQETECFGARGAIVSPVQTGLGDWDA